MSDELLEKRPRAVRAMFARIAPRYDLLNRVLSLGHDVAWRRMVARRVAEVGAERVIDLCTGTGDLALALPGGGTVLGSDFCLPMLDAGVRKARRRGRRLALFAADALRLPIRDGSVDLVTIGFGVRNLDDLEAGFEELARVVRPGGRALLLEFSRPRGVLAPVLSWWVRRVPPLLGRLLAGQAEAYRYLSASVAAFPDGAELCRLLERVGWRAASPRRLTGGVVTLYEAIRLPAGGEREER